MPQGLNQIFCLLFKISKPGNPEHPVVSRPCTVMTGLSSYMDSIFKPCAISNPVIWGTPPLTTCRNYSLSIVSQRMLSWQSGMQTIHTLTSLTKEEYKPSRTSYHSIPGLHALSVCSQPQIYFVFRFVDGLYIQTLPWVFVYQHTHG